MIFFVARKDPCFFGDFFIVFQKVINAFDTDFMVDVSAQGGHVHCGQ